MRRFRSRLRVVAIGGLIVSAASCDSGPKGPGSLLARATGEDLAGVLIQVEGVGIQSFSGRGTTRVYAAETPGAANTHRVLLIDPVGGDLGFEIFVEDRAMEGPIISVLQASLLNDRTASAALATVTIER
ncbi:MAG: hypothetical protein ACKVIN_03750 [Longimicrobiales bacterium]|jgi:hypothetical protein